MQVVYERCCGLDVHKRTVVACVLVTHPDGTVQREVQTFSTMTAELLALSDWLSARAVGVLAMESTGVYWKPVYTLLEEGRQILLVNPQHLKAFTTDSPHWKHGALDRHGRGDRSDPCFVRPAIAVA